MNCHRKIRKAHLGVLQSWLYLDSVHSETLLSVVEEKKILLLEKSPLFP